MKEGIWMKNFFGIIGGMGTVATTNFLLEMNKRYQPDNDQDYLDYVLFNHASIPDRSTHILNPSEPDPSLSIIEDIKQLSKLGADFIAIPCNTAHYYFDQFETVTELPVLNMLKLAERKLSTSYQGQKIGLAATIGTVKSGLYQCVANKAGCQLITPDALLQEKITALIYRDVKDKGYANLTLYHEILDQFMHQGCAAVILGCTEVSYVYSHDSDSRYEVVDSEKLLIDEVIRLGCLTQNKPLKRN